MSPGPVRTSQALNPQASTPGRARALSSRIDSVPLQRPSVSGLVICYDEESHIEACLDSMAWCDEIIVVDSFSTDHTPELARARPNVRFYQHAYRGGGAQRNWALELVRHDWVFVLDADERCTPTSARKSRHCSRPAHPTPPT